MKNSRLLSVSVLWSSVLSDRLLSLSNARQPTNSLNFLSTVKPPNSDRIGDWTFGHYSEVRLFRRLCLNETFDILYT